MKTLDPDQLEVARILFSLPGATGFALAGGTALLLSGAIERPTRDIDAFMAAQPGIDHGNVQPLADELAAALAARKILAILDRAEGRDFTDLHTLSQRHQRDGIIAWAQQLDAGLTASAITHSFSHLDRLDDSELPTEEPDVIRDVFADWSRELRRD